jgi:hypothetical protein
MNITQVVGTLVLAGAVVTWGGVAMGAQGHSTIQRGAALSPVPLDMKGLNRALVREGSYIVNAQGGCNDCHTAPPYAPGGDPFQGEEEVVNADCYLAGGIPFGPFVSRNITPRADGRPAGRTYEQFKELMRHGTDFRDDDTPILQVMPWPVYGKMVDRDLRAVYEYLRAIPMINPRPESCTVTPPMP